jgi:hypothetical protein
VSNKKKKKRKKIFDIFQHQVTVVKKRIPPCFCKGKFYRKYPFQEKKPKATPPL